ncbi:MAG: hypothetical protein HY721_18645 [Planctomycetes bacterium]|nr:hypothetical protein [Planctomycetota bacterium]
MRNLTYGALALGASLWIGSHARAQESFNLTSPVESPDFPNLNADGVIEGEVGQSFELTGNITVASAGITGEEGPQGWSLGISNSGVDILGTTVDGTVSADSAKGGLVQGGFVVNETIDPAKNKGKMGSVQAVVLSFTQPVFLPVNSAQITGKNRYKATVAATESSATLKFEDGLIGKGQPVQNNITFKGQTKIPALGEKKLTIRKKIVAGPEKGFCNDQVDNDLDGKIDCADEDCADDPVFCGVPEAGKCDDGKDNDKDGKTDCDDEDCKPEQICQAPPTSGFDLILSAQGSAREGKKNVAGVDCSAGNTFEAVGSIAKTQDPEPNGAQGWSISIEHDPAVLDIVTEGFPTLEGTDGAALFRGGFQKTEAVDPAKNGGRAGLVSAVVLSFTENVTLDPTKDQTIVRSKYSVKGAKEAFPTTINYKDGLRGVGQPVQNIITVNGASVTPTNLIGLEVRCAEVPKEGKFRRGNANDDAKVNIADPIWIINELVRKGPKTKCQDAADANDDGLMDLSDAMYLIQWRFLGGPPPAPPFADGCGADPTPDALVCPQGSATSCP